MFVRRHVLLACAAIAAFTVLAVVLSHLASAPELPAPLESDAGR